MLAHKAARIGFQVVGGMALCVSLTGCFGSKPEPAPPPYKQKALEDKARGITVATSKVYGCKSIGETEGRDGVDGRASNITKEKIREGAINDLKNHAIHAVKEGQKIMIKIDSEEMRCNVYPLDKKKDKVDWKAEPQEVVCTDRQIPKNAQIISYKIVGDLYDCGEK